MNEHNTLNEQYTVIMLCDKSWVLKSKLFELKQNISLKSCMTFFGVNLINFKVGKNK